MAEPAAALGRRTLILYALPGFAVALPTIPVYIHLPALYGEVLGLASTGAILLAARLFDTVTDPLVGTLSDRFSFRGARRKPWIALGACIAGLGLYKVLAPPAAADAAYLLVWSVVLYGGWTMVAVPYLAWGAELSGDYRQRTRITAWREAFSLIGILAAGAIGAGVSGAGGSQADGAAAIAWAAILAGAIVLPLTLWHVPDRLPLRQPKSRAAARTWIAGLRSLAGNRPFTRLIAAWFLNGLANGIPAALFLIYLEHGLGAGSETRALFILGYFAAAVAAIPLWSAISRRTGKHRAWCVAMIAAVSAFVLVPFIPQGDFLAFAAVCAVTGAALGADLALPPAIQADVVDYDRWRSGRDRAGIQFALWGMSTKLALAAAIGLALPGLEAAGFSQSSPEDGRGALLAIYSLVPAAIKVVAIAIVWRFPLTEARHAIIRRRLERTG